MTTVSNPVRAWDPNLTSLQEVDGAELQSVEGGVIPVALALGLIFLAGVAFGAAAYYLSH
jgi:lactobin A/cerein 7B family class IIb bacteriocin